MMGSIKRKDRPILLFAFGVSLFLHLGVFLAFHSQHSLLLKERKSSSSSQESQFLAQVFNRPVEKETSLAINRELTPIQEKEIENREFSLSSGELLLSYTRKDPIEESKEDFSLIEKYKKESQEGGLTIAHLAPSISPLQQTVLSFKERAEKLLEERGTEIEVASITPKDEPIIFQAYFSSLGAGVMTQERSDLPASLSLPSNCFFPKLQMVAQDKEESNDKWLTYSSRPVWHTLPTYGELNTTRCEEDFDIEVNFLPKEGEEGYIFAITVIPKPYIDFPRIRQNFHFVFNRSNEMGSKRFHATQSAIHRSLAFLNSEDAFNIFAYDTTVLSLSHEPIKMSKESFAQAKRFLSKITLGNIFTNSDIFFPLKSLMSSLKKSEDIDVVILLTNGEGVGQMFNNGYILNNWTMQNRGHCSLFALLMEDDKQIPLTELFTSFNRGKLFISPTRTGIKRQLLKLVKSLKHPIAKDVVITPISLQPGNRIELTSPLRFPHLYLDDPYIIIGSIDKLDDFILFIQGRQNGKWLNIKKKISFVNAKTADHSLRKEWAIYKAYDTYQRYLKDHQPHHLKTIRSLLAPYGIELPNL